MLIKRMKWFPKTAEEQLRAWGHRYKKKLNSCPRRPKSSSEHGTVVEKRNIKSASTPDGRKQLRTQAWCRHQRKTGKGSLASHTAHHYTYGHKHINLNTQE